MSRKDTAAKLGHHRIVEDEPHIPFDYEILYESGRVIVIDKPHFLATTPRGMWYRETALMRLREQFHNDEIIPAHRLDRLTAGVLLFVKHVDDRGAYQMAFQNRKVTKVYECLALSPEYSALDSKPVFPLVHESYILKERSVLQAREIPGKTPNSRTEIVQVRQVDERHSLYELRPRTGKTHQLRVHMNSLGLPILGDDIYPSVLDPQYSDFSSPLQLVARRLQMTDPLSGEDWDFRSKVELFVPEVERMGE